MAIRYKGDIMGQLKNKGYSSTRIRNEKLFGEKTLQDFRTNSTVPYKSINRLCALLGCQPGDILEYIPDDDSQTEAESVCNGIREQTLS